MISDSVFQSTGSYNTHHNLASIELYDSTNITIEHCEFRDTGVGIYGKGEYVNVPGSNSAVVRYNRFTGLNSNAIELGTTASDVGNVAYQNLSYRNRNGGTGGAIRFENSGEGYKNNKFFNNTIQGGLFVRAVDNNPGGGNAVYNNIIFNGTLDSDFTANVEVLHDYGVTDYHNPYDFFTLADYNRFLFCRASARSMLRG